MDVRREGVCVSGGLQTWSKVVNLILIISSINCLLLMCLSCCTVSSLNIWIMKVKGLNGSLLLEKHQLMMMKTYTVGVYTVELWTGM